MCRKGGREGGGVALDTAIPPMTCLEKRAREDQDWGLIQSPIHLHGRGESQEKDDFKFKLKKKKKIQIKQKKCGLARPER